MSYARTNQIPPYTERLIVMQVPTGPAGTLYESYARFKAEAVDSHAEPTSDAPHQIPKLMYVTNEEKWENLNEIFKKIVYERLEMNPTFTMVSTNAL